MSKRITITAIIIVVLLIGFSAGFFAPFRERLTETLTTTVLSRETITVAETKEITVKETITVATTVKERSRAPPLSIRLSHATLFGIEVHPDGYKVVRDALNRTLILVPRGGALPNEVEGIVIYTPVERVILLSSTQVALLERLRELNPEIINSIVGIAWGGGYKWYFPDIEKALEEGRIKDVGAAWSPSFEDILALKPDIMLIYTFPGDVLPSKLDELGIPYAVDNEWLENTALGRFEWIRFIASFYDMDYEAWLIFREVVNEVNRIKEMVSGEESPRVVWFSVYRGQAYVSGGNSYVANALMELGADYIFKDVRTTGSIAISLEELIARAMDVDVIIYASDFVERGEDILENIPELADSKAFKEDRVYAFAPSYYQLGLAYVEDWYRDLVAILYPELMQGHELKLFKKLPAGG